jgi:hypothetical protein
MPSLKSSAASVATSIVAMLVWAAGTAVLHGRFDLRFAGDMVAIALIAGLSVLTTLLLRQQRSTALDRRRIASNLERLERAALPDWVRHTAQQANRWGIKVFCVEGNVVFENAADERHVEAANPPGDQLGQTLAHERVLNILQEWGVPIRLVGMGKRVAA